MRQTTHMNENHQLQTEVIEIFKQGDKLWNDGGTINEKKNGLNLLIKGIQKLQILMEKERDPNHKLQLNSAYDSRRIQINQGLDFIERYERGEAGKYLRIPEQIKGQDQVQQKNIFTNVFLKEKPNVRWSDIIGLQIAMEALKSYILVPIKHPNLFGSARQVYKGVLLYGPPGSGKTYIAQACANESVDNCRFFSISATDFISFAGAQKNIFMRDLMEIVNENKPSLLFIDQFEIISECSDKIFIQTLMNTISQNQSQVFLIGATHLPWKLDKSTIQSFEKKIYIALPNQEARKNLISKFLHKIQNNLTELELQDLASKTEGYSCSDINILVRDASLEPVRKIQTTQKFRDCDISKKQIPDICYNDFLQVLKQSKKSVSQDLIKQFQNWMNQYDQQNEHSNIYF